MKIAVLGSTGMLGSMLVKHLNGVVETPQLDASVPFNTQLLKQLAEYQWIINAIGAIQQRCKDDFKFWKVNAGFPWRLANVAETLNINVIQIATDCIYDGKRGDYTELDAANPVDVYGRSKLEGEVVSHNMNHIRCSIIGPETHGKSLLGWFLNQPYAESTSGYTNHWWNGITTLHFAKVCQGIISYNLPMPHIHHLVPADSVSKYELLKLFAKYFDRGDIKIKPVEMPEGMNRTLATVDPVLNLKLWALAGYPKPPTIAQMIKELAEYVKGGE